jgi:hypothetical protein
VYGYVFTSSDEEGQTKTAGDEYLNAYKYIVSQRGSRSQYDLALHFLKVGNAKGLVDFMSDYTQWKNSNFKLDYNDILRNAVNIKEKFSFKHIFIDEAQDLTPLMWDFVHCLIGLCPDLKSIYVAGDDDQAIYTWAGANPHGMHEEMSIYKPGQKVLPGSFRLSKEVHKFASELISNVSVRQYKRFFPALKHEGSVTHLVTPWSIKPPENCLYLTRTHAMRKLFIDYLMENKTPFITLNGNPGPLQSGLCKALVPIFFREAPDQISDKNITALLRYFSESTIERLIGNEISIDDALRMAFNINDILRFYLFDCFKYSPLIPNNENVPTAHISTIHGSKGLEMDNVMILDDMGSASAEMTATIGSFDNEIRVFYVGATRARNNLYIVPGEYPLFTRFCAHAFNN